MKYYSQFGEDRVIYPILNDVKNGFFVDVGAHDGITDSNTYLFEKQGWDGICIEPHSVYGKKLIKNRDCKCVNAVVWNEYKPYVDFHETEPGGWSRVDGGGKYRTVRTRKVIAYTLDQILAPYNIKKIDLLSIDVEGHEDKVLQGFSLEQYNPRIAIVENLYMDHRHDKVFKDYMGVYGWKQGKRGSNIIYCREKEDYMVVKERYRE
jgi:FkbM family methyltransferase